MPRVYLIGMPGCGKSTMGSLLALELNKKFIDLDTAIVEYEKMKIPDIFKEKGESYFRKIEANLLKELTQVNEDFVMATGGGAPCYYSGIQQMNSNGITAFIDVSPKVLIDRIEDKGIRPLMKDGVEKSVQKLYNDRVDIYKKAQIKIKADTLSTTDLNKRLVEELKLIT